MTTIKSYTDLEQSKKLAEILPLESADMYYISGDECDICFGSGVYEEIADWLSNGTPKPADIPCWSLAALLNVIPQEILYGEYIFNITEGCDNRWALTYNHCENRRCSYYGLSSGADNLIDACVEMILKLHKLNLL